MKRKGKNTSNSCLFVCLFFTEVHLLHKQMLVCLFAYWITEMYSFMMPESSGFSRKNLPRDFNFPSRIIKCLHSLTIRIRLIAVTSTLRLSRSQLNPRLLYKLLNKLQVNLFRASGSYFLTLLSQLFLKAQDFPTFRQLLVLSWVVFPGLKRCYFILTCLQFCFFVLARLSCQSIYFHLSAVNFELSELFEIN